jgi:extracellular factor (EF) 3-hydroxypalmitic acid methyl ester biosynthesis protein
MHSIDPRFKKIFDEMEEGHLQLHQRLNAWTERGPELEARLSDDLKSYASWRIFLADKLGEITLDFDQRQKDGHQKYVRETKYYEIVQEAHFYWRIMNKPEGYAGDAEMMNLIYRNQPEGATPFGMLLHKDAVSSEACQAVRNRRDLLKKGIAGTGGGKILSVAAGPAMEMQDILTEDQSDDTFYCHAFDHDIKTIQNVYKSFQDARFKYLLGNAFHLIKGRFKVAVPRKYAINYCNPKGDFSGVNRLFTPIKYTFETLQTENYDLVYSAGLFDYIKTFQTDNTKGTIALTANLFNLVKPGGSLIIGNFSPANPRNLRFMMEYINDWHLIHRTKEEMLDFARSIPEREIRSMEILEEPLGINYFLKIDKA